MDIQIQIYSLSNELKTINEIIDDQIVLIGHNDLYSSVIYNQSAYIIFEWSKINYIKRAINENDTGKTRFICIDEDISPENRLYLLNNHIDFLTKEKFSLANVSDFISWTKREKHKILIITDDAVQALIKETILKTAGFIVKNVNAKLEATEVIKFFQPDLVLIDLDHKNINTGTIIKNIRNKTENLSLPIVFLSSDDSEVIKEKIINYGTDVVLKNSSSSELIVSTILNSVQGKFFQNLENLTYDINFNTRYHPISDQEYDELQEFITLNSKNASASVIWFKIINKNILQKTLGLSGFRNLCHDILSIIPDNKECFNLRLFITDGIFVLASDNLTRSKARQWVDRFHQWLQVQFFTIRENDVNVLIKALILSDLPKKSNYNLLISEAERLLTQSKANQDSSFLGEGEEQKKFYLIKAKLENAIKSENFKWLYQSILNTKNENQEIIQLMMRVITTNERELTSSDYFEIANESGLLKLLDRFTLEHAIALIQEGESLNIQRRILLNQLFNDYESKDYRQKILLKIKSYNLPKGRLIFQFRQDMTADYSNLINDLGKQLKQANITICLSEFDASDMAWKFAKSFDVDWIRIKPFDSKSNLLDKNSSKYVGRIIKKAQMLGYKVMLPNIDSANLTANIWSLNADYIQGNFIQAPVSDIKYIESEAVG